MHYELSIVSHSSKGHPTKMKLSARLKLSSIMTSPRRLSLSSEPFPFPRTLSTLPPLPLPTLDASLRSYLQSLKPFVSSDSDLTRVQRQVISFENGIGRILQQRLEDVRREGEGGNWVNDNKWWMKTAYLGWRDPLIINSNWWILAKGDKSLERIEVKQFQGE
jgi:hypothetical protein